MCDPVNEANSSEVEKVLLFISDARGRASKAHAQLAAEGADEHVLEALTGAEESLADAHRQLMQRTYFAVPERDKQLAL